MTQNGREWGKVALDLERVALLEVEIVLVGSAQAEVDELRWKSKRYRGCRQIRGGESVSTRIYGGRVVKEDKIKVVPRMTARTDLVRALAGWKCGGGSVTS